MQTLSCSVTNRLFCRDKFSKSKINSFNSLLTFVKDCFFSLYFSISKSLKNSSIFSYLFLFSSMFFCALVFLAFICRIAFSFCFILLAVRTGSIISAGTEDILPSRRLTSCVNSAISSLREAQIALFFSIASSLLVISALMSLMFASKSIPSRRLNATFISAEASFAILNFLSKISRSKNFARNSFLLVEPSLMKERESS